jgi:hypothetical protein
MGSIIYGNDFKDFIEICGFMVTAVDVSYFQPSIARKHVLFPPVLSEHPLATNHSKVFIGRKFHS